MLVRAFLIGRTFVLAAHMLSILIFVLVAIWMVCIVSFYTAGGLIHILLVVAGILAFIQTLRARRASDGES